MAQQPSPSEGEGPLDVQSETTSAPVPETSPPRRTVLPLFLIAVLFLAAVALAVALIVAAVRAA